MSEIRLESVTKRYAGGEHFAVEDVSLSIAGGEFMVLVGPSGCGKSTLLRMIAGLEEVSEGEIWIGDRAVSRLAPRDRDIAMVFQNHALYPHLSVRRNLGRSRTWTRSCGWTCAQSSRGCTTGSASRPCT